MVVVISSGAVGAMVSRGLAQAGIDVVCIEAGGDIGTIVSVVQGGRPACMQLGFCVSSCAINAQWSAANTPLVQAASTGHFEFRPHCFVLLVEHDENGRASGVVYVDPEGNSGGTHASNRCREQ